MEVSPYQQARILAEALPYMQRYDEAIVVVKYGGHAMGEEQLARDFARDIVLLEQTAINPVVVHGGGPQIEAMLKRVGVQSQFEAGLRITDAKTLEIVEMVLAGSINKQMVGYINEAGGKAVGLCGKDGNMVVAKKLTRTVVDPDSEIEKVIDLGFVGEPEKVDTTRARRRFSAASSSRCWRRSAAAANGGTFNVNADTFAGAIAGALKAKRFLLLTDVPGVLDKSKTPDQGAVGRRRAPADRRRHHFGRHDPQGGNLHRRAGARRRRRRHPRRQGAARGAARTVHRARLRHAHSRLTPMESTEARRDGVSPLGPGIIAATSFAFSDMLAKVVFAAGGDVLTLALIRGVVGLGILYFYLRIGPPPKPDTPRTRTIALGLGVLFAAVVYGLFKAIELINVPIAVLTYFIYPLLTGIGGWMFGVERLSWQGALAALVAFFGLALMIGAYPQHLSVTGHRVCARRRAVAARCFFWSRAPSCRKPIRD